MSENASSEAVVVARGVTKRFGAHTAVAGVDFDVRRGECWGLLGPNGAGKTTLLRMLTARARPDRGDLRVLGFETPARSREARTRIGVVPQKDNLDPDFTVAEILAIPVVFLAALAFAAMAMVVTTLARGYEFFLYYTTLVLTPMFLLGGVFFPVSQMPDAVQRISALLPLSHAVAVVRPLATGAAPVSPLPSLAALALLAVLATALAIRVARRRLIA